MELELRTKPVETTKLIYEGSGVSEASGETVVPDSLPDMIRIVETAAVYEQRSKELRGSKVYTDGMVKVSVLYVPETGAGICRVGLELPVSYVFELPEESGGGAALLVEGALVAATAKELNPRKVTVRAAVSYKCRLYEPRTVYLHSGAANPGEYGVEVRTEEFSAMLPVGVCEKLITVSDASELNNVYAASAEILKAGLAVETEDYKLITGKVVLKGAVRAKLLLGSSDETRPIIACDADFPFSAVMDCDGVSEDSKVKIGYTLGEQELRITEESGTGKALLAAHVNVYASVLAWEELNETLLCDAYSTSHEFRLEKETLTFGDEGGERLIRESLRETVSAGIGIRSVYSCSVSAENAALSRDDGGGALMCDAAVKIILEADDGGIYSLTKIIPVEAEANGARAVLGARIKDESYHISDSENIELRFTAEFSAPAGGVKKFEQLTSLMVGEPLAQPERRPSITLSYGLPGESFWDLAKRMKTSAEDIMDANGLSGGSPPEGKMLLIPRRS